LGGAGSYFQHAANLNDAHPILFKIPMPSTDQRNRLEYLTHDDGTRVREFLNIQHATNRSGDQAINPYLMIMNAFQKLKFWAQRGIGNSMLARIVPDPVFTTALKDCETVMRLISTKRGGIFHMSEGKPSSAAVIRRLIKCMKITLTVNPKEAERMVWLETEIKA
jgi:hypothetical protein